MISVESRQLIERLKRRGFKIEEQTDGELLDWFSSLPLHFLEGSDNEIVGEGFTPISCIEDLRARIVLLQTVLERHVNIIDTLINRYYDDGGD